MTVTAQPCSPSPFPDFIPQIRMRTALRGWLTDDAYAIKGEEVVGTRKTVLTAKQLRERLELSSEQRLIVLLFDKDEFLERRIWAGAGTVLPQLAGAGYDWIVAPSYSCWWPRSRYEQMYNLKRSLRIFEALQYLGAPVIPRIGWGITADVDRASAWLNSYPCVRSVALDFSTFGSKRDWRSQVEGLALLDAQTGTRLRYLVNGPTEQHRFRDLLEIVPLGRVSFTSATVGPPRQETVFEQLSLLSSEPAHNTALAFASCRARALREMKNAWREVRSIRRSAGGREQAA